MYPPLHWVLELCSLFTMASCLKRQEIWVLILVSSLTSPQSSPFTCLSLSFLNCPNRTYVYRVDGRFPHNGACKVPGWVLYTEKVLGKYELSSLSSPTAALLCAWHFQGVEHKGENRARVLLPRSLKCHWMSDFGFFAPVIPPFEFGPWRMMDQIWAHGNGREDRPCVYGSICKQSLGHGNV